MVENKELNLIGNKFMIFGNLSEISVAICVDFETLLL